MEQVITIKLKLYQKERRCKIMRCLVVGADNIGCKKSYMEKKFGAKEVLHWNGRNKKMPSLPLVDMIIVLTSFINHQMMHYVKREAQKRGTKVVYIKRGLAELEITAIAGNTAS